MRLQVFLSRSGVCSRRKALEWIKAGRVEVNGRKMQEPSCEVDPTHDRVRMDGGQITLGEKVYLMLHKPCGVVTTRSDRFAPRKVVDLLPERYKHLKPVGRLDRDTSGLLLFTNDGELAYRLTHPKFEVERVYQVTLHKPFADSDRKCLERGIYLEGKRTAPCTVRKTSQGKIVITLHEGRKRQIKLMFAHLGYQVQTLIRIRHASLSLGNLAPGRWRMLSKEEVERLAQSSP